MQFLINENVPATVIEGLRKAGHDVVAVKESMRSATDETVLLRAESEGRILITQDKDFGELAFKRQLPASVGIVLFRLSGESPEHDKGRMLTALESRDDWAAHFAVVTDDRIRMRPLSGARSGDA